MGEGGFFVLSVGLAIARETGGWEWIDIRRDCPVWEVEGLLWL